MESPARDQPEKAQSVFDLPGKSARIVKKYWKLFAFVNSPALLISALAIFDKDIARGKPIENIENINASEIAAVIGLSLVGALIFVLLSVFFYTMVIKLSLVAIRNNKISARDLVNTATRGWLKLLALTLCMGIIIFAGLILLIIPGILAAIFLTFAPVILIDKNTTIKEALMGSFKIVLTNFGAVFGAILLIIGLVLLTTLVREIPYLGPILGSVISIAFSLILFLRYEELKNTAEVTYSKR